MRFIAGGTGRCGSVWFQQALIRLGLNVSHEEVFTHRYQPQRITVQDGEVAAAAAAWTGEIPTWWPVVHLIRDPLDVIRSFLDLDTFGGRFDQTPLDRDAYRFKQEHTTITPDMDPLSQTVRFVVEWNVLWERLKHRNPYLRFHIEDITPKTFGGAAAFLTRKKYTSDQIVEAIDLPPLNSSTERRRTIDVWSPRVSLPEVVDRLTGHPLEELVADHRRHFGYV